MHLPPITIDDRPLLHKRALYTPDLLLDDISVAYEIFISNFTTPYDLTDLLPTDNPNNHHVMNKDVPLKVINRRWCYNC